MTILESNQNHATIRDAEICPTLPASMGLGGGYVPMIVTEDDMSDKKGHNSITEDGKATTLTQEERPLIGKSIVRRLTPLECERLQGFPDFFTKLDPIKEMSDEDYEFWKKVLWNKSVRSGYVRQNENGEWEVWRIKKIADAEEDGAEDEWENTHKPYKAETKEQMIKWYNRSFANPDAPRYKAIGNSIATPFWFWLLRRISAQYERPATLGSLFDGIGGFPLCWERCNGPGTALWASEIEEFPIAVTKRRFPEGTDGNEE